MEKCQHLGFFFVALGPALCPLGGGGVTAPAVLGMEFPTSMAPFCDPSVLSFPYPGSPRGDLSTTSTRNTPNTPLRPAHCGPPCYALCASSFSSAHPGPGIQPFLLYKHRILLIYTHLPAHHVKNGHHLPVSLTPLGTLRQHVSTGRYFTPVTPRFILLPDPLLIMPGPMRRTPSYKASDFLKPDYRRSGTPESTACLLYTSPSPRD